MEGSSGPGVGSVSMMLIQADPCVGVGGGVTVNTGARDSVGVTGDAHPIRIRPRSNGKIFDRFIGLTS
jgi:hypothetical protein